MPICGEWGKCFPPKNQPRPSTEPRFWAVIGLVSCHGVAPSKNGTGAKYPSYGSSAVVSVWSRRGGVWFSRFTLLCITLLATVVLRIHPFLTVTEPAPAAVRVVEGWVPDYVLEQAKAEFERHRYHMLYITAVR